LPAAGPRSAVRVHGVSHFSLIACRSAVPKERFCRPRYLLGSTNLATTSSGDAEQGSDDDEEHEARRRMGGEQEEKQEKEREEGAFQPQRTDDELMLELVVKLVVGCCDAAQVKIYEDPSLRVDSLSNPALVVDPSVIRRSVSTLRPAPAWPGVPGTYGSHPLLLRVHSLSKSLLFVDPAVNRGSFAMPCRCNCGEMMKDVKMVQVGTSVLASHMTACLT